jgi:MFS family permease
MLKIAAALFVFAGGFCIMVLEIVGARYLAKDFGGSFYVWISQIGVVLIALALGYAVGGALADRFQRASFLAPLLVLAGIFTLLIPNFTPPLLDAIVMRHPLEQDIPQLWQKLDPVLGSTLVFFLPCFVLAVLPPYMIRWAAGRIERVGTLSGLIYSAGTIGSIAGVFISGYLLIDYMAVPDIFRATGVLIILLAPVGLLMERWIGTASRNEGAPPSNPDADLENRRDRGSEPG